MRDEKKKLIVALIVFGMVGLIVALIVFGMVGVCSAGYIIKIDYGKIAIECLTTGIVSYPKSYGRSRTYSLLYQNQLLEEQNKLLKELIQIIKDSQDPEKRADKILEMLE